MRSPGEGGGEASRAASQYRPPRRKGAWEPVERRSRSSLSRPPPGMGNNSTVEGGGGAWERRGRGSDVK